MCARAAAASRCPVLRLAPIVRHHEHVASLERSDELPGSGPRDHGGIQAADTAREIAQVPHVEDLPVDAVASRSRYGEQRQCSLARGGAGTAGGTFSSRGRVRPRHAQRR